MTQIISPWLAAFLTLPNAAPNSPSSSGETMLSGDRIDRILTAVRQHLGMEIAFVSRYVDGNQREFTHISTDLPLPHRPGFREPQEESFCYHVLEGRLPQMIHDAADYPLAKTLPIIDLLPVGCHLNVPLRFSDGTVYGSFCALSREADRSITERDMGMLSAFGALAVEYIEGDVGSRLEQFHSRSRVQKIIAERELTILHQPIHSLATDEPMGVECLARFPDAHTCGPDEWFDRAASAGMGLELELFAVECALATLPGVPAGKYASINASPETVLSGKLHEVLGNALPNCGGRERLVVELTEHAHVPDYGALAGALRALKPIARIAIDDVGAGYAGLRHIVELAPDILKLDMSLTRDVHRDKARRALSSAMVRFAREIGAELVAEGIECAEESAALARLGVTYGQGYHYARPLPVVRAQRHMLGLSEEDDISTSGVDRPAEPIPRQRA